MVFILIFNTLYRYVNKHYSVGFYYGFGNEFKNHDYTFNHQYYKLQLNYLIKDTKFFKYESVIQPELNLSKHQLINPYFITAADPDYIEKRERFSKINNVNRYILNPGLVLRKPISRLLSLFILVSFGAMISDSETERLQKGFAISNFLVIGVSYKLKRFLFDIRPYFRDVFNAGLKSEYWL